MPPPQQSFPRQLSPSHLSPGCGDGMYSSPCIDLPSAVSWLLIGLRQTETRSVTSCQLTLHLLTCIFKLKNPVSLIIFYDLSFFSLSLRGVVWLAFSILLFKVESWSLSCWAVSTLPLRRERNARLLEWLVCNNRRPRARSFLCASGVETRRLLHYSQLEIVLMIISSSCTRTDLHADNNSVLQ